MPATTVYERVLVGLVAIPKRIWLKFESRVLALISFGIGVFVATALISWSPTDPSPLSSSYPSVLTKNLAGQYGANLAAAAFVWLGLAAYLLPFVAMHAAYRFVCTTGRPGKAGFTISWVGLATVSCFLAQYYAINWHVGSVSLNAGGILGQALVDYLIHAVGPVGSFILATTVLATSILTNFPNLIARWQRSAKSSLGGLPSFLWRSLMVANHIPKLLRHGKGHPEGPQQMGGAEAPLVEERISPPVRSIAQSLPEALPDVSDEDRAFASLANDDDDYCLVDVDESEGGSVQPERRIPYAPPPATIFKMTSTEMALTPERKAEFARRANQLVAAFADFGVNGSVASIQPGPVVTVYEFEPDAGTKISKIMGLIDDIALALKVDSVFMLPARGKRAIGVQVPNELRETVLLGDLVSSPEFRNSPSPLTIAMGKSLTGDPVCADLTSMPHLLTAGATGAGKSVAINALLCSIIMKSTPEQVRLILVDPKMLELSVYEGIPHLLMPVITDPAKASLALKWATFEMERRYKLMQVAKVRHIHGFNRFWESAPLSERQRIMDECLDDNIESLPFIVLVIDELADLMLTAPKDVETSIQRLAQKARASGIHLVLATQRPSVDIITGVIKANLPCRIAFQTVSKHDSRTILDQNGADKLLGKGDMLFMRPGTSRLERIQGTFIDDAEVINLVDSIKGVSEAHYDANIIRWIDKEYEKQNDGDSSDLDAPEDPKYEDAMRVAQANGAISASFLQRQLKIGYNRAARIVEQMEMRGLVGKADGAKPREWLGPTI